MYNPRKETTSNIPKMFGKNLKQWKKDRAVWIYSVGVHILREPAWPSAEDQGLVSEEERVEGFVMTIGPQKKILSFQKENARI